MKTLVLGLGNPILTDDGVGIHVVREISTRGLPKGVDCAEASVGGLRLLDVLVGYERAILIDAIQTVDGRPGVHYWLQSNDLHTSLHIGSTHDLSFSGALALGRNLGLALPGDDALHILAIEAEDVLTFGEGCTSGVQAAISGAAQAVLDKLCAA